MSENLKVDDEIVSDLVHGGHYVEVSLPSIHLEDQGKAVVSQHRRLCYASTAHQQIGLITFLFVAALLWCGNCGTTSSVPMPNVVSTEDIDEFEMAVQGERRDQMGRGRGRGFGRGGGGRGRVMALIHKLFDHHDEIDVREVQKDDNGVVTTKTTSKSPEVAVWLQQHVKLMKKRVEQQRPIRNWDPLFSQLIQHATELTTTVENLYDENQDPLGVVLTYHGSTECGRSLAELHAEVVSRFVANGWDEASKSHSSSSLCD